MIREYLAYGVNKALKYRANLISWFLADLSLYFSNFFLYYLLIQQNTTFLGLSSKEMLIYISTYTLVNNIFSIFFAESVSHYSDSIESGEIAYNILYPVSLDRSFDLFNFNFPAFLITPILLGINLYLLFSSHYRIENILAYYCYMGLSAVCLKYLFSFIHSFKMIRIKTESLGSLVFSLLDIGEKPAQIFSIRVRSFFIYIIPAFVMSAVPFTILSNKLIAVDNLIFVLLPVIWFILYSILVRIGEKIFQCEF